MGSLIDKIRNTALVVLATAMPYFSQAQEIQFTEEVQPIQIETNRMRLIFPTSKKSKKQPLTPNQSRTPLDYQEWQKQLKISEQLNAEYPSLSEEIAEEARNYNKRELLTGTAGLLFKDYNIDRLLKTIRINLFYANKIPQLAKIISEYFTITEADPNKTIEERAFDNTIRMRRNPRYLSLAANTLKENPPACGTFASTYCANYLLGTLQTETNVQNTPQSNQNQRIELVTGLAWLPEKQTSFGHIWVKIGNQTIDPSTGTNFPARPGDKYIPLTSSFPKLYTTNLAVEVYCHPKR